MSVAEMSIAAYLDRHHLTDLLAGVVGRIYGKPELMKPHPALVHQALELVHASATQVAFIGDSLTDLYVARDTGLRFIGFAKTPPTRPRTSRRRQRSTSRPHATARRHRPRVGTVNPASQPAHSQPALH